MEKTILIIANYIAFVLFICKCFTLIENMLGGKKYGLLFRIFIGIISAGIAIILALNMPINIDYLVTTVVLFSGLLLIFRKSFKDTLFVTVTVMMSIMCLKGMVISLFALAIDGTLYAVCSSPTLSLFVFLVSTLLAWTAIYVIQHFMNMDDLRFAMQNKTQSRAIIIWASLCVLFMFRSSVVYVRDYSIPNMFVDHLSYCFMLLLSFYYLLIYTFKINRATAIREAGIGLAQALGNQLELQSALTRGAIYTSQANLSQNRVISGHEIYNDYLENLNNEYDVWFDYVLTKILPEDRGIFYNSLQRRNLIDDFNRGIEPKPFEYRHFGRDEKWHWVRLVLRMFKDVESADVYLFGYAFDIENEVRDRQALMLGAQTDLFTGLYNKATTETLIGEEIRKGAGILFLLDIDNFKSVNDRFGHEAGDYVLKYFSGLLLNVFRGGDIIGRVGGDEFMIYLKDITDISIAEDRATEIMSQLKTGVDYDKIRILVTTSIGITVIDEKIDNFSVAYNQADSALYKAKNSGKKCYVLYGNAAECSVHL